MKNLIKENKKKKIATLVVIIVLFIAIFCSRYWFNSIITNPLSEDAIVNADTISVSSTVPGRITNIYVKDNSKVKKGDLLFSIEKMPYLIRLSQAKSALVMAEATLNTKKKNIIAEESNYDISNKQINRAKTNLELATDTLARLEPLLAKGYVTKQQVDDARTLKSDAQLSYQQALSQAVAAEALVNNTDIEQALVEARRSEVEFAQWELENTDIFAPSNGLISGLNTSVGQFVISGQSVFTLIDTDQWYVSAYYRETELEHIRLNSCVKVYAMTNKNQLIKGYVQGIGWGVTSTELIDIPTKLPYIPKSLNWVHVEQRFPVRINLIDPPEELMRVGASAISIIQNEVCTAF
ncbi:multidrug transporter subunit MdtN [Orbus mooreae]|uniref:multidrug transporter subunit MdtN n=1 Tax=Orbus mooreae TaxID=3074107 RepID=UPI00370D47C8